MNRSKKGRGKQIGESKYEGGKKINGEKGRGKESKNRTKRNKRTQEEDQ